MYSTVFGDFKMCRPDLVRAGTDWPFLFQMVVVTQVRFVEKSPPNTRLNLLASTVLIQHLSQHGSLSTYQQVVGADNSAAH